MAATAPNPAPGLAGLHLGALQPGARGPVRPAARGHPALRPEHLAAAIARPRGGAGGSVRPAPQRVPRQHVPGRGGRRGRVRGCGPVADPGGRGRGRGPGHHRQDVPARGRSRHRAHPDLFHVRRAHDAAGRDPGRRSCACRRDAGLRPRPGPAAAAPGRREPGLAVRAQQPDRRARAAERHHPGPGCGRGAGQRRARWWSSTRRTPSSRRRHRCRSSTGTRGSSWSAPCPRPSRSRACAWAMPSRSGRPSSAWSVSDRPAASPRCRRRSPARPCATRDGHAANADEPRRGAGLAGRAAGRGPAARLPQHHQLPAGVVRVRRCRRGSSPTCCCTRAS